MENSCDAKPNPDGEFVSKKTIALIYFGGLLLALLIIWATCYFSAEVLVFIWMYPMGLFFFLGPPGCYLGYAVYPFIFFCAFKFRQKRDFLVLLIIYIIILCLNFVGCELTLNTSIT
jgi:hypothetical protein